ncbi:MAG: hypothetical protein SGJ21_08460 [Alphaproteobacteria bacterium]|nr:hypothetical protein [Alphaproteobacteria bacterium]
MKMSCNDRTESWIGIGAGIGAAMVAATGDMGTWVAIGGSP